MIKYLLSFGISMLLISHSYAQNPSEQLLENALKCDHNFEPAEIIKSLQKDGVIGEKPIEENEGIQTYLVIKPTKFHGEDIRIIEGWSSNKMFHGEPWKASPFIAVGVGEPGFYGLDTLYNAETKKQYPPCYTKVGIRDNSFSYYSISAGDYNKVYLTHICRLGDGIMVDHDKCNK